MSFPGSTPRARRLEAVDATTLAVGHERPQPGLAWKHAIDRACAALLLVLMLPLFVVVAVALKVSSRSPALVRERRVDRQGRSFALYRFRQLPVLPALCRLPELFNVLRGELSFVGPRPERPEFVELFGENLRRYDQPRRVKPGITGWEQVRGLEGDPPLAERARWDEFYVENWSPWLDLRIVLATVRAFLTGGTAR